MTFPIAKKIGQLFHLPIDRVALVFTLSVFVALALYRGIHYWVTGFLVPDEYGYVGDAWAGSLSPQYANRYFFGAVNTVLFRLLHVTNATSLAFFLPFYILIWSFTTVIVVYKTLQTLSFDRRTIALTLLSSVFIIGFILPSLGVLTEPVGLSMAMSGIYCMVRFSIPDPLRTQKARAIKISLVPAGVLFFAAANYTREPYLTLFLGSVAFVTVLGMRRAKRDYSTLSKRGSYIALALVLVLIPVVVFTNFPSHDVSARATYIATQDARNFLQITSSFGKQLGFPSTPPSVSSISTSTVTGVTSGASTAATSVTSGGSATTTQTQTTPNYSSPSNFEIPSNVFTVFFLGVLLSWGPIPVLAGTGGLVLLAREVAGKRDGTKTTVMLMALASLASYFGSSTTLIGNPNIALSEYSTLFRFASTSLPAYFLLAPFFLSRINRRQATVFVVGLLVFAGITIPLYETYASSNLVGGSSTFDLGYRSLYMNERDFLYAHQSQHPIVMGLPNPPKYEPGFDFLTGVSFHPYLTAANFSQMRWTHFYLFYDGAQIGQFKGNESYIASLISGAVGGSNTEGFSIVQRSTIYVTSNEFYFLELDLRWSGGT